MKDMKRKMGRPKGIKDGQGKKHTVIKETKPRGNPNWRKGKKLIKKESMISDQGLTIKEQYILKKTMTPLATLSQKINEQIVGIEEAEKESLKKRENIKDTRFQARNSYSPGRPKGSRNKTTLIIEQIGLDNAEKVYLKVVELAMDGDFNACKFLLDRVYPPQKSRKFSLEFYGPTKTIQDINAVSEHVLKLAIEGEISFEEAEECGKLLEQRMKVITDADVMPKIEAMVKKVESIKNGK